MVGWGGEGESFKPFDNVFNWIIFLLPKQHWSLLSKVLSWKPPKTIICMK